MRAETTALKGRGFSRRKASLETWALATEVPIDPYLARVLRGKSHLLVGFAFVVTADLDRHFPVKPSQKIEQLVRCEAAEMPVHQM